MQSHFKQVTISTDKVIPNPKNPRIDLRPGMPLYERLKDSIEHFGYLDPIIWNKRTGMIVSGHQRFQVMKDIAKSKGETIDQIDVMEVDMSESQQDAFMVAINKITGLWDNEKLSALFKDLAEEDLSYTGFEDFEIDALLNDGQDAVLFDDDQTVINDAQNEDENVFKVTIYFKTQEERNNIYQEYKGKGYKVKM